MKLIDDVGFDGAFSFAYSARPGTPAAELPDPVPAAVSQARLEAVQAKLDGQYRAYSDAMVGTRQRVLVTGRAAKDATELVGAHRRTTASSTSPATRRWSAATSTSPSPSRYPHSLRGELRRGMNRTARRDPGRRERNAPALVRPQSPARPKTRPASRMPCPCRHSR